MRRRGFLAAPIAAAFQIRAALAEARVFAYGDGIPLSPEEYSHVLSRLAAQDAIAADDYSRGGVIEQLETRMAELLGKETAVWLPTGTLANHLAVRLLAGNNRRVLVQAESHLYNDSGDCAQILSGLNLIPLAPGRATFTLADVELARNQALMGRVPAPVGAIQIETPVRRRLGERFDFAELQKICGWARERGIGLHLDGARLFIESGYTRRPVKEYCALFDTVYISMYKYFNAASGAILAGPKSLLGELYNTRRMFGGGLHQSWPFAAVALHYLDGFEQRFRTAVDIGERVLDALSKDGNFTVERIPNGTNIFRVRSMSANGPVYQGRLEAAGISVRTPSWQWLTIQVNETWNRLPADEIVLRFQRSLS